MRSKAEDWERVILVCLITGQKGEGGKAVFPDKETEERPAVEEKVFGGAVMV